MTKKEKELLDMMQKFKRLNSKEQGFIFGLTEGLLICKNDSALNGYDTYNQSTQTS